MSIFYQEEAPKRCKCLVSALKDAFAKCHSTPPQPQEPAPDFDHEDEIFVSAVISKYMESKSKRKTSNLGIDSFQWAVSEDAILTPMKRNENENDRDEFVSVGSHPSGAATSLDDDAFASAKTCFSRSSSLSRIDDFVMPRSIIMEFIHCQGWPFGLCRKALLLPPLPKSPADSWSWRKTAKFI